MSRRKGGLPELPFRALGDPLYSQRNPHQIFLLALSVLAGYGLVEGTTGSSILDDALHPNAITLWGWCLMIGSATGLLGMWWPRTWAGLLIERAGLAVVAAAALIYSYLVYSAAPGVAYTAYVHIAFGLACVWRVGQISVRLHWVRQQVARVNREGP